MRKYFEMSFEVLFVHALKIQGAQCCLVLYRRKKSQDEDNKQDYSNARKNCLKYFYVWHYSLKYFNKLYSF